MIPSIVSEFRSNVSFATCGEVELFRNLALAIVKHSNSTFVDETHGGKVCNVTFTSVTGRSETCEIADLLIISCSANGKLRATFWQAKKQGKSKWLSATTGNEQLDFDGQFNQWDLLCRRPAISAMGSFQPPSNLLSSFTSASIGSFGVFYHRSMIVEVCHSIAAFVGCHNPMVKHPKMSINGYLSKYFYLSSEIITAFTLDTFLIALFDHRIGAILNPVESAHRWLVQYARLKVRRTQGGAADVGALDRFLTDGPPIDDTVGVPGDGLSVLIITEPKSQTSLFGPKT